MRKVPMFRIGTAVVFAVFFIFHPKMSAAQESRFSVSYTIGAYQPSLRTLNKILGDPRRALLQDPNYLLPRSRLLPVEARNIVAPPISGRTNYGVEVQWEATERISLVGTLSLWNG
ncbi:MAG: hypothetical protein ACE5J1_03835, partial [Nitrospiria bacterium]